MGVVPATFPGKETAGPGLREKVWTKGERGIGQSLRQNPPPQSSTWFLCGPKHRGAYPDSLGRFLIQVILT
jgi:hypothetical protein